VVHGSLVGDHGVASEPPQAMGVVGQPPHSPRGGSSLSLGLYIFTQWQDFCPWPDDYTSLQLDSFHRMVMPKFPPDFTLSHSPFGPTRCIYSNMGNEFSCHLCCFVGFKIQVLHLVVKALRKSGHKQARLNFLLEF
jgi:hypothetical protein